MKRAVINDLKNLKNLKNQLKLRAEQELLAEQRRQTEELLAKKEANIFRDSIGGVTPIKTPDSYVHQRTTAIEQSNKSAKEITRMSEVMEQWSDEFDASHQEDDSGYVSKGSSPDLLRKLRKGHWPVQAGLDLHGMHRDQARTALSHFLHKSKQAGLRNVCVVHGKGIHSRQSAVLPSKVRSWLCQSELVQAFCPANLRDGGDGALYVLLKAVVVST